MKMISETRPATTLVKRIGARLLVVTLILFASVASNSQTAPAQDDVATTAKPIEFKFPKLKVEVKVFANAGIADAKTRTAASKRTLRDMKSFMNFLLH
jgi:hypothetical protein